jgi:signal transduction histidine kinase
MMIAQRRVAAVHRTYAQGLLAAQEEERGRVAREVHDDAVQRLGMLQHELRAFQSPDAPLTPAQRRHLDGIAGEIDDLTEALRQLAHRLHPAVIEQAGLVPALQQLAAEVSRTSGLSIAAQLPPADLRLPADRALALFRIAQEALHNAVRHAGASAVSIEVRTSESEIELLLEDNGHGFDPTASPKGLGLTSIRERARLAGGDAVVRSRPGSGTTVIVRVPQEGEAP